MRALDFYSGVGGWSVGLRLAGVDVVAAYEWWKPAVDTYTANLGGNAHLSDVRSLDLEKLPKRIDLVVGSPPCTEFSYSNRGGNGDLSEGMLDLVRFFEIVAHVKPKHWVMENVPRVADIVREAIGAKKGPLAKFKRMAVGIHTLDFSDFGVPQARKRCLIGNIPFDRLLSYAEKQQKVSLGAVVEALARPRRITDPVWGAELARRSVTEMTAEPALDSEQLRMNREAKLHHPVYNRMSFPDSLASPSRTVTATCTRVSRESIVIADPLAPKSFRRLTIRERATLQGFPITYQFFGTSYSQKLKMVGNALPPPIAFLVAHAVRGTKAEGLPAFSAAAHSLQIPETLPKATPPENRATTFPKARRFRAAIPNLRFGSGVRFDLSNGTRADQWLVQFFYGPSKDVQMIAPDAALLSRLKRYPHLAKVCREAEAEFDEAADWLSRQPPTRLQLAWSHRGHGQGPFDLVDKLGYLANLIQSRIARAPHSVASSPERIVASVLEAGGDPKFAKTRKIAEHASGILAGFVVGSWFNANPWHDQQAEKTDRSGSRAKG